MTMAANLSIFDISGRAMSAQLVRLNTTASNLANAGTVAGSEAEAFRSMKPVFRTVMDGAGRATVAVDRVTTSNMAPTKRHDPDNPLADGDGNVWERSEEHTSELQSLMRISYAVFCLQKKNKQKTRVKQSK